MSKPIGYFVGGSITLWVLLAIPARRLWGDEAALQGAAAMLLCLVPAVLTFLWGAHSARQSADQQLIAMLGGTGIRMFVVLGGALLLTQFVPYFQGQNGFWAWLLLFYLITLAFEVVLLVTVRNAAEASGSPGATSTAPTAGAGSALRS